MLPVLTPAAVDEAAPEPVAVLIERAGAALAREALGLLGGTYGRRVTVVAGGGNNGADGRAAARRLERRGVRVRIFDAVNAPQALPACDLVIDAAYGTGFHGEYKAPDAGGALVLAADIPSGVDGLTGAACDGAVHADVTLTFAAYKPGLLLGDGPLLSGAVEVADIGLDVGHASASLIEDGDVFGGVPRRPRDAHKYASAVLVVAGSPGMGGAALLCSRSAMRAGAGYVRLCTPGSVDDAADEVVSRTLPSSRWGGDAVAEAERMRAAALGPGLGRTESTVEEARAFVAACPVPVVIDADGLYALGKADEAAELLANRSAASVLTPHDGEFARLAGRPPGGDRLSETRELAARVGATVLLKGPTTVIAAPDGAAYFAAAGSARLATAGTGDVLTGVIAAFMAIGVEATLAAALAAHAHGAASALGRPRGFVAGDLLELLPAWLSGDRLA
jgi:hydroxyethylthiazole kinase-like uncharacterized protein yjeF